MMPRRLCYLGDIGSLCGKTASIEHQAERNLFARFDDPALGTFSDATQFGHL